MIQTYLVVGIISAWMVDIGAGISANADEIPTEGKVFYTDFLTDDNYGKHYVKMQVGSS